NVVRVMHIFYEETFVDSNSTSAIEKLFSKFRDSLDENHKSNFQFKYEKKDNTLILNLEPGSKFQLNTIDYNSLNVWRRIIGIPSKFLGKWIEAEKGKPIEIPLQERKTPIPFVLKHHLVVRIQKYDGTQLSYQPKITSHTE